MSLACTAAVAATVYKWVDENGVVHFSDQPHENAEKGAGWGELEAEIRSEPWWKDE